MPRCSPLLVIWLCSAYSIAHSSRNGNSFGKVPQKCLKISDNSAVSDGKPAFFGKRSLFRLRSVQLQNVLQQYALCTLCRVPFVIAVLNGVPAIAKDQQPLSV